jgi:hypothetical protein
MKHKIQPVESSLPKEEQEARRKANGGFLYPDDHPFAVFEGNFTGTGYFTLQGFTAPKVKGEINVDEDIRRNVYRAPMVNRSRHQRHLSPVGALKRPE